MKRKVGNGRGGGGDSNPSDLVVKKRRKKKRKMKRKDEGEMATPPRSDRCWSRSPSSGDEGRWRGPKTAVKWVVGLRRVGLGFLRKSLEFSYILGLSYERRISTMHIFHSRVTITKK